MTECKPYIKVKKDGPYLVFGIEKVVQKFILADWEGVSVEYANGKTFEIKPGNPVPLCRCGRSAQAPFCNGEHAEEPCFDGAETAGFDGFSEGAEVTEGSELTLLDNRRYCAFARFCEAGGRVWNLVQADDPDSANRAIQEANLCPSGRLIILDKQGNVMENKLPPGVNLIEDLTMRISGPIWVLGGIRVENEDGQSYEVRMKQTLCRCGRSENKPFCDGRHGAEPGWCAQYPAPNFSEESGD